MARELKFRAWQKAHKKMFYKVNLYSLSGDSMTKAQLDNRSFMDTVGFHCEIMQSTGLQDKRGKDIYEGDILRPWIESIGPYWVVFENGSFVCYHKAGRWGLLSRVFEADILRDYSVEIIGNIYENGDLLP